MFEDLDIARYSIRQSAQSLGIGVPEARKRTAHQKKRDSAHLSPLAMEGKASRTLRKAQSGAG
eukprot:10267012-Alexandrium_andersonii.AAC.1